MDETTMAGGLATEPAALLLRTLTGCRMPPEAAARILRRLLSVLWWDRVCAPAGPLLPPPAPRDLRERKNS